jgi:hypothetical protein
VTAHGGNGYDRRSLVVYRAVFFFRYIESEVLTEAVMNTSISVV